MLVDSENLVMVEYFETILPLIFSLLGLFFKLHPNGRFIPMYAPQVFTTEQLVQTQLSLLLYAGLEGLLFWVLVRVLFTGPFRLPFAAQLGFVMKQTRLETAIYIYTWLVFSVGGTFDQFGHDWTFKFNWTCTP